MLFFISIRFWGVFQACCARCLGVFWACFGGCLKCGHVGRPPSQLEASPQAKRRRRRLRAGARPHNLSHLLPCHVYTCNLAPRVGNTSNARTEARAERADYNTHAQQQWTLPPLSSRIRALPTMRTFRTTRPRRPPASRRFWRPLPAHAQQSPSRPRLIRR